MRRLPGAGGVLSYFARHRTAANLLLVLMLAAGLWAAPQMRAQFFPDTVVEEVDISVRWDGAGPEDVDSAIIQLLEPALLAVEGVDSSTASSREGAGSITLKFEPGTDMTRAADDVQAAVDAVTNLPTEADEPRVDRRAWRDRVTDVVVTGPVGRDQLMRFADEFVARLFRAGVTRTTIRGLAAPSTLIEVPSINLVRHGLELSEIASAIAAEAETSPAGDVTGANARIRTGVAKRTAAEVAAIVIRSNPDGSTLTVGEVAAVYAQDSDRDQAYFVGANPAIAIRVDRSAQGDAIDMQARVEAVAAEMQAGLPQGVTIDLIRTRAEAITGRLRILLENGAMGLALVVLLLFLFLNARTAFWVALGIPTAMAAAIALMYLLGLTLNMISLFALIITLGIVVDDAIVVGEHADFRARELGESPAEAAENAARRMATPVFASTVTTVIAFVGLMVVGGTMGNLIADIPVTVSLVLIASLVECFLVLPNHMVHALAHTAKTHWYDWPSRQVNRGFGWLRDRAFRPLLAWVIWARYPVVAAAVLLLAAQAAQVVTGKVQWRFFNAPEQGSISGNFAMLPGATRADTMEMLRALQQAVEEVSAAYEAEHGTNPVTYALAELGGTFGGGLAGADTKDPDQLGSISIELIDADLRPYSSFTFLADLQAAVPGHPMLEELSFRGWRSGPGGPALSVQLYGAEAEALKAAAEALKGELAAWPEVSALEDTLAYDKEELALDLTSRGQALGFTIDGIGRVLRERLNGIEAATYPDGPRSAEIRVELPAGELTSDFLERTLMRAPSGAYVPLADIVTVERRAGFATVRRENGLRVVTVTGDVSEDDPARASAVSDALRADILPRIAASHGVGWRLSGLAEEEEAFLSDALLGFLMCLLGIYLALAWIFASWRRPVVVMSVIPFGLIGAVWGHGHWEVPLSMFSIVGLIGMTGIIINDSIVLVTTIDERAETRGLVPAIIDGAADRLRPVFLTTATTVFGLAPLLFESSIQAQFLRPTVITLVYGLGFGMVLVLLLVPALMAIQADTGRQVRALRRALGASAAPGRRARAAVPAAAWAAAAATAAAFAATIGWRVVTGDMPAALAERLPWATAPGGAVVLFLALAIAVVALAYAGGALAMRLGRRT